jgi:hypothetical protein
MFGGLKGFLSAASGYPGLNKAPKKWRSLKESKKEGFL